MDKFYKSLLENNKTWAKAKIAQQEDYFTKQAEGQRPPVLWIGCADSRVPATEITSTGLGDIFVHRNIANMVISTDVNLLSVMDYAINALQVKHVIVCGHHGCGGVQAAMGNQHIGLIDNWIRHIKDVGRQHKAELDEITDPQKKFDRLVELNVKEQVRNAARTTIVQQAWQNGQELHVHGWVYGIGDGLIRDLNISLSDASSLDTLDQLQF